MSLPTFIKVCESPNLGKLQGRYRRGLTPVLPFHNVDIIFPTKS